MTGWRRAYFFGCHRFIELNSVRAGMVNHPGEYSWSSYRHNVQGEINLVIRPHVLNQQLGADVASRREVYRELFRYQLDPGLVD